MKNKRLARIYIMWMVMIALSSHIPEFNHLKISRCDNLWNDEFIDLLSLLNLYSFEMGGMCNWEFNVCFADFHVWRKFNSTF